METLREASHSVRYLNELRALDVLFRDGAMSRANLARSLGLNRSTTGSIVNTLLASSFAVERSRENDGEIRLHAGRPGIDVALNPEGAIFLGAEIEVDRLMVVAIDLTGRLIRESSQTFHAAARTPEATASALVQMIKDLLRSLPDPNVVRGICVAVPALIEAGLVRLGLSLNWRDVPVADFIGEGLCPPLHVAIENAANAFAIAETYSGNSHKVGTVAFVVIESGAGAGIVSDGRLFRGSGGMAGEFGHLNVGGTGYVSRSGGILENYIGKDAVIARYRYHGGSSEATLPHILDALNRGEAAAINTAADWGRWLARGLSLIVNLLNPGLIIIGGSVGRIYPFAARDVEAHMHSDFRSDYQMPRIEMSELGDEGPAFGAALTLHQRMFSVDERALFPAGTRSFAHAAMV